MLWWNKERLPSPKERQKILNLWLPDLFPCLNLPTCIGLTYSKQHITFCFVILGFGFTYNENWDQ